MKVELKDIITTINRLITLGFKIVIVETEGQSSFFSVTKFEPAIGGPDPVGYNYLEGVEITTFIHKGHLADDRGFKDLFEKHVDNEANNLIKYKFHKDIKWHWFAP